MHQVVNCSQKDAERAKALQKEGESLQEVLHRAVNLGLYQLEYRRKQQPARRELQKTAMKVLRKAQRDPKLAVELGIAHLE